MPAGAASRYMYALGAGGVGAARPAPAASPMSASRSALGARRTAHGAARRGCCAPVCQAAQPMAWALRARAPAAARSRPRAARSAPMAARRCAPRALRACVPGGAAAGCHRRLALRARRQWMDGVGAARPGACCSPSRSCRGRGWGEVFQISSCTGVCGERFVLPQHMCRVSRRGAPLQPKRLTPPGARPTPRTLSARARLHAAGEGRHDGHVTI